MIIENSKYYETVNQGDQFNHSVPTVIQGLTTHVLLLPKTYLRTSIWHRSFNTFEMNVSTTLKRFMAYLFRKILK